jgi:hypothetical protein
LTRRRDTVNTQHEETSKEKKTDRFFGFVFSYFPTTINRMVSPRSAQLRIHIFHFLSGKILFWRGEGGFCLFLSETIIACSTTKKMCVVVVVVVCYSALGSVVQLALIFFMGTANKFSFFLSCLVERRVIASRLISGGMRRAGQHVDMTHREKEPTLSDAGPSLFSFFKNSLLVSLLFQATTTTTIENETV